MFVPAGYVKLEGATVDRSNYPRLVALADKYSLWTTDTAANPGLFGNGNGSTTMVLPNWTGRMAQFAATAGGAVAAGLPNISGQLGDLPSTTATAASLGALLWAGKASIRLQIESASGIKCDPKLEASRSNAIYGSSTTVQPPAINVFAIMRY